ncbi:MAG: hypothetical protein ACK5MR_01925 [Cumulibacter sp.]
MSEPSEDPGAAYDRMRAKEEARSQKRRIHRQGDTQGWTATGTLLSGIIVWGLIGWGLSSWTDWRGFLPIGVLLGAGLGVYLVVKQSGSPPPLMDISKKQDGGLFARRESTDDGGPGSIPETDERHT